MKEKKFCIVILGMHRSGTSALSGLIHELGFDFGSSITEPSWDNPRGFYENYKIQDLNDRILTTLDRSWDTPGIISTEIFTNSKLNTLKKIAKKIIKNDFQGSRMIAIKDPRISLLFPFWQAVLVESGYQIRVIMLLRDPSEIAASLEKRNFFSEGKTNLLTMSHWLSGEHATRGLTRSFMAYDQLLAKPGTVIQLLIRDLLLPLDTIDEAKLILVSSKINSELRHNKSRGGLIHQEDNSLVQRIYDTLLMLLQDESNKEVYECLEGYKNEFLKYDASALKRLSGEHRYFAKLIFDDGGGYTEAKTRSKLITEETEELSFDLDPSKEIDRIVIFPANAPCVIKIKSIAIGFMDQESPYELSDNSHSQIDNKYIFGEAFPQIIIKLQYPSKIKHIQLDVAYKEIGKLVEKEDLENISKERSAGALAVLLKYPVRALKSINLNNYRTLRRAMKRESPRTILRNFVKLLKRPDHQKLITNTSSKNKAAFIDEVGSRSKRQVHSSGQKRPNHVNRKLCHVLYVAPSLPEYDKSSGGKRATKILELLSIRSKVCVWTKQRADKKYTAYLESEGIDVFYLSSKKLKQQLPIVDIIICAWYYTYYEIDDLRLLYPEARIIIDSVDVHWVREERSIGILKDLTTKQVKQNKIKEVKAYDSADLIWAVSEEDRKAILNELPDANVRIISNIHSFQRSTYTKPNQSYLLFIGGYNHYPNLSAAIRLAKEIFPLVRSQSKEVQLILAGSNAPKEILELDELDGVSFIGWVSTEELEQLYDKTLLSVAPLLTGAGIKGKITEAISYMTPVVTNAIGNEGIHLEHEVSGLLAESDQSFAEVIIEAIRDEHNLEQIAKQAQEKINTIVGPENVLNAMWHSFYKPVDICIVTYNRLDLLKACISSIDRNTKHPNYNIIVYSNGCSDGTRDYLQDVAAHNDKIIPILSDANDVFVRPNNKMMKLHEDRDVVLLNNDVEVTDGWLIGLAIIAYRSANAGIVGSKVLYPDNRLQEFGSELFDDGTGVNIGKGDNPDLKEYRKTKAVPYVSGCAMYIKRKTIEEIGVFDDAFHPCYCEDSDYCYTAWEHGIATLVTPHSTIYHHEGSTSGTDTSEGFKKYQIINMQKFLRKHKTQLESTRKKVKKANNSFIKEVNAG